MLCHFSQVRHQTLSHVDLREKNKFMKEDKSRLESAKSSALYMVLESPILRWWMAFETAIWKQCYHNTSLHHCLFSLAIPPDRYTHTGSPNIWLKFHYEFGHSHFEMGTHAKACAGAQNCRKIQKISESMIACWDKWFLKISRSHTSLKMLTCRWPVTQPLDSVSNLTWTRSWLGQPINSL